MTLPASGTISMSTFSVEMGQAANYANSISFIKANAKVPSNSMNGYYSQAWYKKTNAGNCSNGNCTANCNCGNIQCTNCYIAGTVNCVNCDTRSWLQANCNCACTYNCTTGLVTYNCNCVCETCFPAGVLVLMHSGEWKPVEQVVVGDFLMGIYGNAEEVEKIDTPILGPRRMMSFAEDRSLAWSDEHPFWARKDGKEWFAAVDVDSWLREVETGATVGLKDNASMMEMLGAELATLNGFEKRTIVDVTHEYATGYHTPLYFPVTKSHLPFIVAGYVSTGGTDEFKADYSKIRWEDALVKLKAEMQDKEASFAI